MRRPLFPVWALLALGALAALSPPGAQARDGGWWSALDEGLPVALSDVLANAEPYRHRTITFACIFHAREATFDPLHTPFNAERHDNFSVWPDGAPLWEDAAYRRDYPFVYIARNHPQRDALLALEPMTRIQLTGRIRAVTRAGAFFEVFAWRRTGHRLGREVVESVLRGDNYIKSGARDGYQLAARAYRDALKPDLPPVYAQRIGARLAQTLRQLGHPEEAARFESSPLLGAEPLPEPEPGAGGSPAREGPAGPPVHPFSSGAAPGAAPGTSLGAPTLPAPAPGGAPGSPDGPAPAGATTLPAPSGPAADPPAPGGTPLPLPPGAPILPDDQLPGRRPPPRIEGPAAAPESAAPDGAAPGSAAPAPPGPGSPDGEAGAAPPTPATPAAPKGSAIPPTRRPRLSGVK